MNSIQSYLLFPCIFVKRFLLYFLCLNYSSYRKGLVRHYQAMCPVISRLCLLAECFCASSINRRMKVTLFGISFLCFLSVTVSTGMLMIHVLICVDGAFFTRLSFGTFF